MEKCNNFLKVDAAEVSEALSTFDILLVEDSKEHVELFEYQLNKIKEKNYRTKYVANLEEGLRNIRENKIDVAFFDLTLPDSSLNQTLSSVLNNNPKHVPIIILSSLDDPVLAKEALQRGAFDYLAKENCTAESLKALLDRLGEWKEKRKKRKKNEERKKQSVQANVENSVPPIKGEPQEIDQGVNFEMESIIRILVHDLKSPLRNIENRCEWIDEDCGDQLDVEIKGHLDSITKSCGEIKCLAKGLSLFSEVYSEKEPFSVVSLDSVLKVACTKVENEFSDVAFEFKKKNLFSVQGDHKQLVYLFGELISNAIKFRSENSLLVSIEGTQENEKNLICVRDNGLGLQIDSDKVDLVFNLFHRLNPEKSGAGVGLFLCRSIMNRHGGKIWAKKEEEGSLFCLEFSKLNLN